MTDPSLAGLGAVDFSSRVESAARPDGIRCNAMLEDFTPGVLENLGFDWARCGRAVLRR